MEKIVDNKGTWIRKGVFKILVAPSEEYMQRIGQYKLNKLLNPEFKKPTVSISEVQIANFILDITERLEILEGGSI